MEEQLQSLWNQVLLGLQTRVNKSSFETWLSKTRAHAFMNNEFIIATPNEFTRDWLDMRYSALISNIIEEITGEPVVVLVEIHPDGEEMFSTPPAVPAIPPSVIQPVAVVPQQQTRTAVREPQQFDEFGTNMLNPKYTFDTFVIGTNNRFAHAASLAVAEQPAKAYNPLFLYGGVGLGKTHLMHAIGHYILDNNPNMRVLYISSEKFTNEFINAIMNNRGESFRNKYRNIDILLIDDIQFLAGKEQTQEEFFHTFNSLHEASKQIIISSDRPPKEIPTLEDRLRSRFEWGLITDIQPPDLETRIAILRKKAKAENLDVTNDVMIYIASQVDTNIRELEGALIRVVAYSSLINADITVQLASDALKDIVNNARARVISVGDIQQKVCEFYGTRMDDFKARKRTKAVSLPRQVAMYLARELTELSLPKIGEAFGGRDHTTVIHAYDKISEQLKVDPELAKVIQTITEQIKNQHM